jgi:putative DNA modification/repair radical SAM protein
MMNTMEKLAILADAAKYDVACTSSGHNRAAQRGQLGSAIACGICHSFTADGRCISLLKILQTNDCEYDCKYCVNRAGQDVPRATFTPHEVAELTIRFYQRNYIEGLFLSSAVKISPDFTMEMICETLRIVRHEHRFAGYIHVKAIPGASQQLVNLAGTLADRISVNIELPSRESLSEMAPDKTRESILSPMARIRDGIVQTKNELTLFKNAPRFAPMGSTALWYYLSLCPAR